MLTASITRQSSTDGPSNIDGAHCACCAHESAHGDEGHDREVRCEHGRL
jgi:hypothetical protein